MPDRGQTQDQNETLRKAAERKRREAGNPPDKPSIEYENENEEGDDDEDEADGIGARP